MSKRWRVLGIGRYRYKTIARLRAWLFETFEGATLWPEAWVTDGR